MSRWAGRKEWTDLPRTGGEGLGSTAGQSIRKGLSLQTADSGNGCLQDHLGGSSSRAWGKDRLLDKLGMLPGLVSRHEEFSWSFRRQNVGIGRVCVWPVLTSTGRAPQSLAGSPAGQRALAIGVCRIRCAGLTTLPTRDTADLGSWTGAGRGEGRHGPRLRQDLV